MNFAREIAGGHASQGKPGLHAFETRALFCLGAGVVKSYSYSELEQQLHRPWSRSRRNGKGFLVSSARAFLRPRDGRRGF